MDNDYQTVTFSPTEVIDLLKWCERLHPEIGRSLSPLGSLYRRLEKRDKLTTKEQQELSEIKKEREQLELERGEIESSRGDVEEREEKLEKQGMFLDELLAIPVANGGACVR